MCTRLTYARRATPETLGVRRSRGARRYGMLPLRCERTAGCGVAEGVRVPLRAFVQVLDADEVGGTSTQGHFALLGPSFADGHLACCAQTKNEWALDIVRRQTNPFGVEMTCTEYLYMMYPLPASASWHATPLPRFTSWILPFSVLAPSQPPAA